MKDQNEVVEQPVQESIQEQEQYVARKAYEEVTRDMHKNEAKAKEAEARAAELEAKLQAIEEAKLKEQNQWEELYKREREAREAAEQEKSHVRESYLRSVKLSALKAELGGSIKDEYLSFANIDAIELGEDGSLSSETVVNVANSFRKEHPGLIPTKSQANITGQAASSSGIETRDKNVNEMSLKEKLEQLAKLKAQANQ